METTIFQYAIRVSSNLFILRDSFDGVEEIIRDTERHNTVGSSFFCTIREDAFGDAGRTV